MIESCALAQVAGAAITEKDQLKIICVTIAKMISTVA
jgi:hypothetical protein